MIPAAGQGIPAFPRYGWMRPGVLDAEGSVTDLRLLVDGADAVFLVYGMDTYPTGGGNVNTFNYVEVSSAAIP